MALQNTAAPGGNFGEFSIPVLNDQGQTAFHAYFDGMRIVEGIFSEGGGSGLQLLARSGDMVPGFEDGGSYRDLSKMPLLRNAGGTVFSSFLFGPGINSSNDSAIFMSRRDFRTVAQLGNAVPSTDPGIEFDRFFSSIVLNDAAQVAFMTELSGPGVDNSNDFGVFSQGGGLGLRLVAREGDPAPVGRTGVDFSFPATRRSLWVTSLNQRGDSAFVGSLTGTRVTESNDHAIFRENVSTGIVQVVREGDAATDAGAGLTYGDLSAPLVDELGRTAFFSFLEGASIVEENEIALFREETGGLLKVIAQAGDPAPGAGDGVNFVFNYPAVRTPDNSQLALNKGGQISFLAELTGPDVTALNGSGIFSDGAGNGLELVVRGGDSAPVGGGNYLFDGFRTLAFNNLGQTAFSTFLSGENSPTSFGIFARDVAGEIQLVAKLGDQLDVSDNPNFSDLRTISGLEFAGNSGNSSGRASGFNDLGQLAFRAEFTDGTSGIFVSNLVAVPELSSLALLAAALLTICCQRR